MFQANARDLYFVATVDWALAEVWTWDETELDEIILFEIASSYRRAEQGEREWASNLMNRQPRRPPRQAHLNGCIPGTRQPSRPFSPPDSPPQ